MDKELFEISDIIPKESDFPFDGHFSMNGQFSLNCKEISKRGDLCHSSFSLESDFGNGTISMFGKQQYMTVLETYRFKQGMINSARLMQPFVGLYFQIEGAAQALQTSLNVEMDLYPGEANILIIPPMHEMFELKEEVVGASFTVVLAKEYLNDLAGRYPYLLEPLLAKVNRGMFGFFNEKSMVITPQMRSTIQRIQHYDAGQMAGSLFLEAQILNLLSQLFNQIQQPASSNGYSLSRSDRERIYRAGEILTEQLETPPTLAELSKLIGTNEFKLKRGFKAIFGTSPYAYHLQHKLERARSYILDTDLTIAEIAYRVGYSDPAHLTNAFRKQYNLRPSDLR